MELIFMNHAYTKAEQISQIDRNIGDWQKIINNMWCGFDWSFGIYSGRIKRANWLKDDPIPNKKDY